MSRTIVMMSAALFVSGAMGCGSSDDSVEKMTVRGTVSQSLATTSGARAIAVGANGRTIWTTLDAHGDFTLRVPVGQSYRVVIANPRTAGGQQVTGRLVLRSATTTTRWIRANASVTIDLGRLEPATATAAETAATPSGVRTQSMNELEGAEGEDDHEDDGEHDDDAESHEGSSSELCSEAGSVVELQASNPPAEEARDEGEHEGSEDEDCSDHEDDEDDEHEVEGS